MPIETYDLVSVPLMKDEDFNDAVEFFREIGFRVKVVAMRSTTSYSPTKWIALAKKTSQSNGMVYVMLVLERGNELGRD